MDLLSFPFRLTPAGTVATVDQDTDDARIEALAVLCLTRKGERTLVPDYGVTDPAFEGLDLAEVTIGLDDYAPEGIAVDSIDEVPENDTTTRVTLVVDLDSPDDDTIDETSDDDLNTDTEEN